MSSPLLLVSGKPSRTLGGTCLSPGSLLGLALDLNQLLFPYTPQNVLRPKSEEPWSCSGRCGVSRTIQSMGKSLVLIIITAAFGIMIGYVADLAFYKVPDPRGITGLNWRLMMGSACLPAIIVFTFVFLCPESPRWYMSKNRHAKAYQSMCKLRYNKVQAARDIFYMHTLLEAEKSSMILGNNKVKEMITVPRNRRAMQASEIVMFMQQVSIKLDSFPMGYVKHC